MKDKKSRNKYIRDYREYYDDVMDYSIEVYEKFAMHNTFMFFIYGLGLSIIDIDMKKTVCSICWVMSGISIAILFSMKHYFLNNKKRVMLFSNIYLIVFLSLLMLMYFYHPSQVAYTILICTFVTTAMTNVMPMQYIAIVIGICALDLSMIFTQKIMTDVIDAVGYVLNDFLLAVFAIGINILYSDMKFKEFKQKHFLENESYLDPLTKIYNRRYVERYVEMNLDASYSSAMILIDVDNFKTANDELGHEVGDEILCRISDILRNNFRKIDCVARIGGDEFLVFLPHLEDDTRVVHKVKNILKEFPMVSTGEKQDKAVAVSLSIGVVFTKVGEKNEYEELYRRADRFMYKAKKGGKGRAVMEIKDGGEQVISNESIRKQ